MRKQRAYDIANKSFYQRFTGVLSYNDSEDFDMGQIWSQFVVGDYPAFRPKQSLDPLLLYVWVLFAEGIREFE